MWTKENNSSSRWRNQKRMTIKCYTCSWIEFWTRKEKNVAGMVGKVSAASVACTSGITVSAHTLIWRAVFRSWGSVFLFGGNIQPTIKGDQTSYLQLVFKKFRKRPIQRVDIIQRGKKDQALEQISKLLTRGSRWTWYRVLFWQLS